MITTTQKERLASLNQGNARAAELSTNLDRAEKVVAVTWDFAVDGGAHAGADIDLGYTTEEACLVTKVIMHELTNVVGASSTYTLEFGSTAITDAIGVASMATGTMALASSATAIPVAAGQALQLNIGTANASAGKVRFYVYMLPQRDN
jgi:hypothetical protein